MILCVIGSFNFLSQIEKLEVMLKEHNIHFLLSKKRDDKGITGCLQKIDEADVVYVVNPGGYIGKSVSVDVGYAYAKNKPIYTMYPINDPPVMKMVKDNLSFKQVIELLKLK